MNAIKIELPDGPSKGDEIDALRDMATVCGRAGGYLRSLFTEELVDWVDEQMGDDIEPNLWAEREFWRAQANDLRRQLSEVQKELQAAKERAEHDGDMLDGLRDQVAGAREDIRRARVALAGAEECLK